MCDEHTEKDNEAAFESGALSRRAFGVLTAATLAASVVSPANAAEVKESNVTIKTPAGDCDAHFVHPTKGKSAAVLVWPDIMGLRPAFRTMGKRLAESGYAVLTINPYYRTQKGEVFDATKETFSGDTQKRLVGLMQANVNADNNKVDAIAFTEWLDKQKEVDAKKKIATTGYCMGGPLVFRSAAYVPNRIGAACTFHGGGIGSAQPNSPHLMVPQMKASFLCCIADNDDKTDPEAKNRLEKAFTDAKLPHEIKVYEGCKHGWCPIDSQVYDKAGAEDAWAKQLALFKKTLA